MAINTAVTNSWQGSSRDDATIKWCKRPSPETYLTWRIIAGWNREVGASSR